MHTVQLLLKTSKYERHEIDRRFHALAHLHNVCVKHARKCMIRLQHDKRYAELRQLYNELVKKEKMSKEEKSKNYLNRIRELEKWDRANCDEKLLKIEGVLRGIAI